MKDIDTGMHQRAPCERGGPEKEGSGDFEVVLWVTGKIRMTWTETGTLFMCLTMFTECLFFSRHRSGGLEYIQEHHVSSLFSGLTFWKCTVDLCQLLKWDVHRPIQGWTWVGMIWSADSVSLSKWKSLTSMTGFRKCCKNFFLYFSFWNISNIYKSRKTSVMNSHACMTQLPQLSTYSQVINTPIHFHPPLSCSDVF